MEAVDYLVVGAGLTGATIARQLADAGRDVLVVDRRPFFGGNTADVNHFSGIRYNLFGPHYFRTSSDEIWEFAARFSDFYKYEAEIMTRIDGRAVSWPLSRQYIDSQAGPNWTPPFKGTPTNFEEAALSLMPEVIYRKAVKNYTEKMWGVPATRLSADLCKRFDVRKTEETRLTPDAKYQGIPKYGYTMWVSKILQGIRTYLDCDYLENRNVFRAVKKLIFTGPLDAYYGYDLGRLKYRGQKRNHTYLSTQNGFALPAAQVNIPNPELSIIRTLEWKQMMAPDSIRDIKGTLLTTETPYTPADYSDFEYPFPDKKNQDLATRYTVRAARDPKLLMAGRLGENRYLDMDQAIGRALLHAKRLLQGA